MSVEQYRGGHIQMLKNEVQNLIEMTQQLLLKLNEIEVIYKRATEGEVTYTFYDHIEPFANDITTIVNQWEKLTLQYIKENQVKYMYEEQVASAVENILTLAVICFQKDTRYKKFIDLHASVKYHLTTFQKELPIKETN
jgi:hypothetical protein